jgi:hypothetical protein
MESIASLFDQVSSIVAPYKKMIALLLAMTAVSGFGTWWYVGRKNSINQGAHEALLKLEWYSNKKVASPDADDKKSDSSEFKSKEEKWATLKSAATLAYDKFSSSNLAPFFLAYSAQAMGEQGNKKEATSTLENAVGKMSSGDLKDLYQVKLSILKIDSGADDVAAAGLQALQDVASQSGSGAQALALYRLGEYFWTQKKFDDVKNYWGQLMLNYGEPAESQIGTLEPSVWAEKARSRFELITAN